MAHAVPESAHRQRTPKQDKGGKSEKVQNHPTFCAQRLELHPHCIHMKRWTARTLRYILKFEKVKVARTTVKEVVLFHSFCGSKVGKGFRQGGVYPPVHSCRTLARQYTPDQLTSRGGDMGTATLQPPPASSHSHFSERFSKI